MAGGALHPVRHKLSEVLLLMSALPIFGRQTMREMNIKALFVYMLIVLVCGGLNALTYYLLFDSVTQGQWINSFLSGLVVAAVVAWVRRRRKVRMQSWGRGDDMADSKGRNGK